MTSEQREHAAQAAAARRALADADRRARAELIDKLRAETLTLRELLDLAEVDAVVGEMKVLTALQSLPGVNRKRALKAMKDIGIADTRHLRGLVEPKRRALLDSFPDAVRRGHEEGIVRGHLVVQNLPVFIALDVDDVVSDDIADAVLRNALKLVSHLGYDARTD